MLDVRFYFRLLSLFYISSFYMICLDANDLVYSKDPSQGITSAGFSVDSIMMKMGISPIATMNTNQPLDEEDVASLFKNKLVVPNWILSYNNNAFLGGSKDHSHVHQEKKEVKDMYGDDDDILDDDLHDRLLDLVKEHDLKKPKKKRLTKKAMKRDNKKTRRTNHS